jgi:PAS domain S-box-containing protein
MLESSSSSELRYRDFFENVSVGLFAVAPDGRILDANPALVAMLQYPGREELLDSNISEFQIDPADSALLLANLRKAGEISGFEVEFGRPDDTTVWLVASARAIRDETGRILYYQGAVEDITARKHAEEAARESEHRFEAFMNHTPVMAFIKDDKGRYEYANDPCLHFFNKKRHELYGHTDHDILPASIADPLRAHDMAVVEDGSGLQTIETLPGRDGEPRSFMVLKFPITDPSERNFVGGFALDITDRRRAEEAERHIARRFRDLFDSSPDAIFVQDLDGNILDVNPEACSMCGESHANLVGRSMSGLIPEEHLRDLLRGVPHLARGEVMHAETIIRSGNGHSTPIALSSSRMEFTGRPALLTHARDTSEQKKLQEQFHQSQKMEAIGRLAGGIAHDFNNLLTAIIGYNELVLGGLHERDPLRHSSEEVRKAAERAARLTRQLLAVSRRQTLQPRILDLNSCVAEIEKMLRRLIGDDVELSVIPSLKPACVKADPSQLEQVLMNLAVNARDAMPGGGQLFIRVSTVVVTAMLDAAPDLPPGDYVVLRVTDTGTGMTEETQARIFEPFFTTKDPGKGTGLGLATCYGIVKQSGGRILCDSSPQRGTTFSIYLPQVMGTAQAAGVQSATPLPRGTETILVVEDAAGVRNLASRVLRSLGYQLLEAENGFEALAVISQQGIHTIDLILTDVTMPKMGGRELVERVRAEHPGTRVVFTSGNPGADAGLKAFFSQPGTAFLHKPFTPTDLACVVRGVITGPRHVNGSSHPAPVVAET